MVTTLSTLLLLKPSELFPQRGKGPDGMRPHARAEWRESQVREAHARRLREQTNRNKKHNR
jgi:hypothetical protein